MVHNRRSGGGNWSLLYPLKRDIKLAAARSQRQARPHHHPRPDWDNTIHDFSVYKLTTEQLEQKRKAYTSRSRCTGPIRPTSIIRIKVPLKISCAKNVNEKVSSLAPFSTSNAIQCYNPTRLKSLETRVGEEVYLPEIGKGGIKRNRHGSHGARVHKKTLKRVVFKPVSPVVILRQRKQAAPDSSLCCSSRLQRTSPRAASDKGGCGESYGSDLEQPASTPTNSSSSPTTVDFEDEVRNFEASKKQKLTLTSAASRSKELPSKHTLFANILATRVSQESSGKKDLNQDLRHQQPRLWKWGHTKFHAAGAPLLVDKVGDVLVVRHRVPLKMDSNGYGANTNNYSGADVSSDSSTSGTLDKEGHLRARWQKSPQSAYKHRRSKKGQENDDFEENTEGAGEASSHEPSQYSKKYFMNGSKLRTSPTADKLIKGHFGSIERTVPTDGWDVYNEQGSSESSGAQLLMFQKEFQQYISKCHSDLYKEFKDFKSSITRQLINLQTEIQKVLAFHESKGDEGPSQRVRESHSRSPGPQAELGINGGRNDEILNFSTMDLELAEEHEKPQRMTGLHKRETSLYSLANKACSTARSSSQSFYGSDGLPYALQSSPERETGTGRIYSAKRETGESQGTSPEDLLSTDSQSDVEKSTYLTSFEEIERIVLSGGSLLDQESNRPRSASLSPKKDALCRQPPTTLLPGPKYSESVRIANYKKKDESGAGVIFATHNRNSRGSRTCGQSNQIHHFKKASPPRRNMSPTQIEETVQQVTTTYSKFATTTNNPQSPIPTSSRTSDAFALDANEGKKWSTYLSQGKTLPELNIPKRTQAAPASIATSSTKPHYLASTTSAEEALKKREHFSAQNIWQKELPVEPTQCESLTAVERLDLGEKLPLGDDYSSQTTLNGVQGRVTTSTVTQGQTSAGRGRFTLRGWAAAFLQQPEDKLSNKSVQGGQQFGAPAQLQPLEGEAARDILEVSESKRMGSPIKYEAVAQQTKEPITLNREKLDLKFPGKKSKGGCAWTVDELDEVGPPWSRGTSGQAAKATQKRHPIIGH